MIFVYIIVIPIDSTLISAMSDPLVSSTMVPDLEDPTVPNLGDPTNRGDGPLPCGSRLSPAAHALIHCEYCSPNLFAGKPSVPRM